MAKYVARRLMVAVPTLVGATLLVFFLLRVLPGDAAQVILGGHSGEVRVDPVALQKLQREIGLDRPLHVQYLEWLGRIAVGDLGNSLVSGRSVGQEIWQRFPLTLELALMAEFMAILIGIPLGITTAIRRDSWVDYTLRISSVFFLAVPSFWLALIVLLVGVRQFNWIPPMGYHPLFADPTGNLIQFFWPAVILASHELARVGRMTRSAMLEVLREDYVQTARAKGLKERVVLVRHALKNALIPVATIISLGFAGLLAGVVVLEAIFTIPGLGTLFLQSLNARDFTMVQGLLFVFASGFVLINLAVDLLYGVLDPRIRYS